MQGQQNIKFSKKEDCFTESHTIIRALNIWKGNITLRGQNTESLIGLQDVNISYVHTLFCILM